MSTETTPAIERAAEENYMIRVGSLRGVPEEATRQAYREKTQVHHSWEEATRPIIAAALDVEEMAMAVQAKDQMENLIPRTWGELSELSRESYRSDARAIRARILGKP